MLCLARFFNNTPEFLLTFKLHTTWKLPKKTKHQESNKTSGRWQLEFDIWSDIEYHAPGIPSNENSIVA